MIVEFRKEGCWMTYSILIKKEAEKVTLVV